MLQQHRTSLPRFFAYRMIDLIALIAAFAIGMPFFLVATSPFLQGL
jgi:hypothetical protein